VESPWSLPLPRSNLVPVLLSVNVGMPRDVEWQGKTVFTGIWKEPVVGPCLARRTNLEGDGQGDAEGHGGEQRAMFVYQLASYWHWRVHFGRDDLTYGCFGENFTVDGLPDDQVCIGDRYAIGEAEFEVTQPRVTCFRVGMRLGEPDLPSLLVSHHRPGFYMRVITEGRVQAGNEIVKTKAGPGALSIADADALLYLPHRDPSQLRVATQIPALSPGWQQSFRELLEEANVPSESSPPSPGTGWAGFRSLQVTGVVHETPDVTSITFSSSDGVPLPAARAGQYLTLRLPEAGTPAPVRNYSLSGPAGGGTYRISVKHEPGGVASTYLNSKVRIGDLLDIAAPRGEFVLEDGSGPVLLVSAGIGVTPVLSMLHQLAGEISQRDVWWIHGARRPEDHALADEARSLIRSLPYGHECIFYSAIAVDAIEDEKATAGRLNGSRLAELDCSFATASAYICGPSSFMDDMNQVLLATGLTSSDIHTELFGALNSITPGVVGSNARMPHQPEGSPGTGPLVTFARSNLAVRFGGVSRTILELAEACDLNTRWSCRSGVCHTCVTPVLAGQVSYEPDPLEFPEADEVLICCARPETDLVLDM
jgi:ferredoxin-NADP reductase/MOSC domain-containing protein YiiM